jgi:hypothetical protein
VKNNLLAFIVAFAVSLGLTLLSWVRVAAYSMFVSNARTSEFSIIFNVTGSLLSLFGLAIVFGVFYFLANKSKITVTKPTTLALLTGFLLGSSILYMCFFVYYFFVYGSTHSGDQIFLLLENYLDQIGSSFVAGLWHFFPAMTALLYVKLKEKKSNQTPPQENTQN